MKNNSIRFRLLKTISIPLIIGALLVAVATYFSARHEAEEIYDAQMSQYARMLELITIKGVNAHDSPLAKINIKYTKPEALYEKSFAYRVWLDGKIVMRSNNSSGFGGYPRKLGFSDVEIASTAWRFLVIKDGPMIIEVAEDYDARLDIINKLLLSIFIPLFLLLPIAMFAIWIGLKIGLKPLQEISNAVAIRSPDALQPIDTNSTPEEIEPLVDNINNLMLKIAETIDKEKRFTSYAAHELRTPLAALKAQIQVALRHKDLTKQREMFEEVTIGLDRMNHLVEQLLTFMRVQKGEVEEGRIDISKIIQNLAKDYAPKATDKNIALNVEILPNITRQGNAEMLEVMFNNLISNAVKYTPKKGRINIKLIEPNDGEVEFEISNSCKEISKEGIKHIFDPFYRLQGEQETGAGIGLSIVKWVSDNYGWVINADYKNKMLKITCLLRG